MSHILPVYNRNPIEIDYGKGSYLYAKNGRRYLDFVSGVAVNCLGHCHPKLVDALKKQSEKLWHVSNIFTIPGNEEMADILCKNSFAETMFFCNSGAEAIECTIKMVRKYHDATGNPDKYKMITFTGAFHGRTLAAIWASKRDKLMQDGFGPPVEGFDNVEFNNLESVRKAICDKTAAILVEPVQGDGGVRVPSKEFLQGLRKICDEHGLLLCFDEVQSGVGRTGTFYAHEQFGVTPDIMATAKGIGGGFPLGACMATNKAACGMTVGTHGSTYGGNPLGMAVGRAVLEEILAPGFLDEVNRKGAKLKSGLEKIAAAYPEAIEEVRGIGLLLGIKTKPVNADFNKKLSENGLCNPLAGENTIRFLPPLNISDAEINEALSIVEKVCKEYKQL